MHAACGVIGMCQPMFLPWAGYFEQVASVDRFVVMDDVQYTKRDWRNRNRIKTATGPLWLTVPVKRHPTSALIRDVEIDHHRDWVRKHLKSIEVNYRRRPHFEPFYSELSTVLERRPRLLLDLNLELFRLAMTHLRIETPLSLSSGVPRNAQRYGPGSDARNERILEVCQHFGARALYDGRRAADFLDVPRFERAGVRVLFQDYDPAPYPQAFGPFVSHMSIIDLIMNVGPSAGDVVRAPRTVDPLLRRAG